MSSSRRTTGEVNILAMLDGQAPGRRFRAVPRALWYGAAGVLACSLLAGLAWLVRGGTPARDAATAASRDTGTAIVPHADGDAPRGALIVDVAQPAPAMAPAPAAVPTVSAAPPLPAAGVAAARSRPDAARQTATRATAPAAPSTRTQPANRAMPPHAPSLAHAGPAPLHQKRGAAAARTTPPAAAVDTDVAVISAILQHAGPRNEAAEAAVTPACADGTCGSRLPSRQ
jgi:hypothetical protein